MIKRTDNKGFAQNIRRAVLFHELAENYFRTDGLQNYDLAHESAKSLEGFSLRNPFPGSVPNATRDYPNDGYYFGSEHIF